MTGTKDTKSKGLPAGLTGWLVSILIPVMNGIIPDNSLYTKPLKLFFMITLFVICLVAFNLLPLLASAVLLPALYTVSEVVPADTAFGSWTNTTVWMILGALVLATVLDECGLLIRIAYWTIRKCGGTFTRTLYGIFIVGIILNLITFCNAFVITMVLVYGICKAMNLKPSKESALICFAGCCAGVTPSSFLYNPGYVSLMETAIQNYIPDYKMGILDMPQYLWGLILCCVITLFVLTKLYGAKDMKFEGGKEYFDMKYKELGPMSRKEKKGLAIVGILLIYLITTNLTGLPAAYGFMLIPYLLFVPGISVGNGEMVKKVNFPIIFFIASCLGIGVVGNAVGFGDFIASIAVPMLSGKSTLTACLAFLAFGAAANLFMTPYAMVGGLSIPFANVALQLGMSPAAACMILVFACDFVFLPHEVAGYLVMYGFGLMPMKEFIKTQSLKSLVMLIVFVCVMFPLWGLMSML